MKVNTKPYIGQHCESTATGTLLGQIGVNLSEPMLFGLGEGLSFIIWNMKIMGFPFIGGRVKTDLLTANIARNLGLKLIVKETSSTTKAWQEVKELLDSGKAVGLKLDCYCLEYFTHPIHFAGHYVAILGYDDKNAFLVDTKQQGSEVTSSLESLEKARNEKGPMSSRNLYYIIEKNGEITSLKDAIVAAIRSNTKAYLNPPIKNLGYKGIAKASEEIIKWFDRSKDIKTEFAASAMIMERAGTGGALFRNLYRDFLKEAYELTGNQTIGEAHRAFVAIARSWSEIIALFEKVAETGDRAYVLQASEKLKALSNEEKSAVQILAAV
ncbi:BtrH N-terminal domain-containing protein [Candidatus Nomurabacteria bacterium]|nr:BtrH N-terminal domain-containing protein [Candidatus Nomurabacteria bacterium]